MMKEKKILFLLLGVWLPAAGVLSAQDSAAEVRTIRLLQDDAQLRYIVGTGLVTR